MLRTKLVTLLSKFSKEEMKQFELFLASPYFNQSEKLLKFFRLIEPYHPLFDSAKLEKERLYKSLHGKSKYNDSTMRELISELFKLSKRFLLLQQLESDELQASKLRYTWFRHRQMDKLAISELENRSELLENYERRDNYFYHHRWLLDLDKFDIAGNQSIGKEHQLIKDFDLYAHVHSLNRNYLVNCFVSQIYLLNLRRIYQFSLDEALIKQLEIDTYPYFNKGDNLIDILFSTFQLLRADNDEYFFELKKRFLENDPAIDLTVMQDTGVTLENYCASKIRQGEERFIKEVVQIYRFEIENNLHLNNNKMSPVYYRNVVVRGAETDQLEWIESFVENHKVYLPKEVSEVCYLYARAHVLFARKRYQEALRMALSCNETHFVAKVLIRFLVARSQYELEMMDELRTELDSLRHHLADEKLTAERRQHLQMFVTALRNLAELKSTLSREKWLLLSKQVEEQKGLANHSWFKLKVEELKITANRKNSN